MNSFLYQMYLFIWNITFLFHLNIDAYLTLDKIFDCTNTPN